MLKDKNTYQEAYYFLDGNKVTHPALFAEPLNQSILWLAEHVKQDIQYSNNLQDWSFADIGIDRCLNAIDQQFHNQGIDFYPNVLKLKQALETPKPERFENIEFNVTSMVNNWLEKHKK